MDNSITIGLEAKANDDSFNKIVDSGEKTEDEYWKLSPDERKYYEKSGYKTYGLIKQPSMITIGNKAKSNGIRSIAMGDEAESFEFDSIAVVLK